MKTIGLLGGMSWQSTELYYRYINEAVHARLGGLHSAQIVLYSVEFQQLEDLMRSGAWDDIAALLSRAAQRIEAAGADVLLICTNTMHKVAPQIEQAVRIPLLHMADATALRIQARKLHTVGLLGTRFTMEDDFYRGRLEEKHGLKVVIPAAQDRSIVHEIIFNELCQGIVKDASRREYLRIIETLRQQGAQGIIEGCTEIGLLLKPEHSDLPLFDTAKLHALAAVDWALA